MQLELIRKVLLHILLIEQLKMDIARDILEIQREVLKLQVQSKKMISSLMKITKKEETVKCDIIRTLSSP